MTNQKIIITIFAAGAVLTALITMAFFHGKQNVKEQGVNGYTSITMAEAKERFQTEGEYVIVDVRRADEFAGGHIPGAINIPNESIGSQPPEQLPDMKQEIYVYCRSGNRSKQAAEKLAAAGYTGIIEFGGILDWTGEIE